MEKGRSHTSTVTSCLSYSNLKARVVGFSRLGNGQAGLTTQTRQVRNHRFLAETVRVYAILGDGDCFTEDA